MLVDDRHQIARARNERTEQHLLHVGIVLRAGLLASGHVLGVFGLALRRAVLVRDDCRDCGPACHPARAQHEPALFGG